MSDVETRTVAEEDAGQRLDRWFRRNFPDLSHGRLQKLLRTGQVRVDGRRAKASLRLDAGQEIRVPPLGAATSPIARPTETTATKRDAELLRDMVLHRDDELIVIDKPAGLAVQGGSATARHLDGMLDALRFDADERPRLVHRLDKDTSGIMVLARNAAAARRLGDLFRGRDARKTYWAVTVGVPETEAGRLDLPLGKRAARGGERVGVDTKEGKRAVTDYRVIEVAGDRLAWLALSPRTGRTHQLRAHCVALGCPILGDGKYGGRAAFVDGLPPGAKKLHLHARGIALPRASGKGELRFQANLPPHMAATWDMLGFGPGPMEDPFAEID